MEKFIKPPTLDEELQVINPYGDRENQSSKGMSLLIDYPMQSGQP